MIWFKLYATTLRRFFISAGTVHLTMPNVAVEQGGQIISSIAEARRATVASQRSDRTAIAATARRFRMANGGWRDTVEVSALHSDHEISEFTSRGDIIQALNVLMQQYGRTIYRYCRGALQDSLLTDDVHQQIFMAAFHDLPEFRGYTTVRTWLFRIARQRVLDADRARRRTRSFAEDTPLLALDQRDDIDSGIPAGERIHDLRLGEALIACLNKLSPHVRRAVLLRFQQGFTFEEMAEICGVRAGTLQVQVMRAMPVLRHCIEVRIGAL